MRILLEEKEMKLKGGLYHRTQIKLAYNSNRIEGSRLSEDQDKALDTSCREGQGPYGLLGHDAQDTQVTQVMPIVVVTIAA